MKVMEGSEAIAEAVRLVRPSVIAAYPITPQTHIVESLARAVADGALDAEFLTVESEHSAASAVLGASATGVRTYTATSSQGLLYMAEVVFNIAGMRLPIVMTVANRALSGPLSIWNDHQDSMTMRDSGWVQLFAQTPQEAHDLHVVAYRLAEEIAMPVMVCVDGFVLTHAYEPVAGLSEADVAAIVPAYRPSVALDPERPMTFGSFADPSVYTEARGAVDDALAGAPAVLASALSTLGERTGRVYDPAIDVYRIADASVVLVAMGTAAQTARVAVDEARADGEAAGLVAIRTFRPFPSRRIRETLEHAARVVVLDRSVSLGAGGIVAGEVRSALSMSAHAPPVVSVIGGLGGRDVSIATLRRALRADADAWIDREEVAL